MPFAVWHLIGHLQRNKVRRALGSFDLIHSVDSERLARELSEAAAAHQLQDPARVGRPQRRHAGRIPGESWTVDAIWPRTKVQGTVTVLATGVVLNIDGKTVKSPKGSYITDVLTAYTIDWLNKRDKQRPFFVYLSHKGVHAEFEPAERHKGKYASLPIITPPSMYLTVTDSSKYYGIPTAPKTKVNYSDIQPPRRIRHQFRMKQQPYPT